MKKLKFLMLFCLFGSMLFAAQKTTKTVKNEYDLKFNPNKYVSKETEINGQKIKYRAYENVVYVKNPVDKDYQNMNIYILEEYFNNSSIGNYNSNNAPIFFPNTVGGYMPGKADTVGLSRDGKANSLTYALSKGYVVAAPGVRGRTLTDSKGNYTGKAPAAIVDLKAAVRYLYLNDEIMPGDANKIISNGTSAGGALSALLGATGNSTDYLPYLKEIGAADTRDDIFAVSAYCPITNLENADSAYEWMYNGVNSYSRMEFTKSTSAKEYNDRSLTHSTIQGNLTEDEIKISNRLKALFPIYLNSLKLTDDRGNLLTLDKNGNGSFKTYLATIIRNSANKALKEGKDISQFKKAFTIENDKVVAVNLDIYTHIGDRMKSPPAFDSIDSSSGENNLFGDKKSDSKHFTKFSFDIANKDAIEYFRTGKFNDKNNKIVVPKMADKNIIKMMNPMYYIDNNTPTKYWRIRHGAIDKDTSLAIPAILVLKLKNSGKVVDFASPWGQGHGGDYDLEELFNWIDGVVKK
ncbi:subtype B tannase [Fusobacterium polymorphum]|uniref:subtype B tannase n=1 Tax=Fusobacterium nucleatum subsp. polymorphum TaxID=76857 RepID=UPI00300855CA